MENPSNHSVFYQYYHQPSFVDRFLTAHDQAVDVIVPVIHTNELWEANLLSIYREIPVNRLILGDGGCVDQTLEIVKKFPRVTVLDHRHFTSLGFSLRKMMEAVTTTWFVYLHSDVYLPPGWFSAMVEHQQEYDWFECRQQLTVLADYPFNYTNYHRPLSGSQMGKTEVMAKILPTIEDDYLYRNEDLVIAELVRGVGGHYGRADNTFHYHQMMHKDGPWKRKITGVSFTMEKSPAEEEREFTMQARGLIKYTQPSPERIQGVQSSLEVLRGLKKLDQSEFTSWVSKTNPAWLPYISSSTSPTGLRRVIKKIIGALYYRYGR